jgi:hypothetical protein
MVVMTKTRHTQREKIHSNRSMKREPDDGSDNSDKPIKNKKAV